MVTGYVPGLNIPTRHTKGLIKMFSGNAGSGILGNFYYTTSVVQEGTPMKFGGTQDLIVPCVRGTTDNVNCVGLALQSTYDETGWDAQLKQYRFFNQTTQRLDGQPIGLLMGAGYALTTNYVGSVSWGDPVYIGASGLLAKTGASGDLLPAVFETSGVNGATPVRIRFNFPLA